MTKQMTAQAALDRLETLYTQSVTNLRDAVRDFVETGARPDPLKRAEGVFAYPELRIRWDGDRPQDLEPRAYARLSKQGVYSTTVTRPDLFRPYLTEQLELLEREYDATFEVEVSRQEIPFPYVTDGLEVALDRSMTAALARWFPTTDLANIGDEIPTACSIPQRICRYRCSMA